MAHVGKPPEETLSWAPWSEYVSDIKDEIGRMIVPDPILPPTTAVLARVQRATVDKDDDEDVEDDEVEESRQTRVADAADRFPSPTLDL